MAVRNKKSTVSTIVRKAVDMAIVAVRKAEFILSTIVRKAVEVAILAVRKAERKKNHRHTQCYIANTREYKV